MNLSVLHKRLFMLLLSGITLIFFWMLSPFYEAILWSFILALLFLPLQQKLLKKTGYRPNLSAAITLLICLLSVILPLCILGYLIIVDSREQYVMLQAYLQHLDTTLHQSPSTFPSWMQTIFQEEGIHSFHDIHKRVITGLLDASRFLAPHLLMIGQDLLRFGIGLLIMLYLLFFLLRDGITLATRIQKAIPLHERYKTILLGKFMMVIRATLKGNLIVAMLHGTLGGLTFWILDIPNPLLWGTVLCLLALLPSGTSLVWIPAILYYLLTAHYLNFTVLCITGIIITALIDNLLRPRLVGKAISVPDYLVFLATLGGLLFFGLSGFIIGPVIAALFIAVWHLFSEMMEIPADQPPSDVS